MAAAAPLLQRVLLRSTSIEVLISDLPGQVGGADLLERQILNLRRTLRAHRENQ